VSRGRIRTIECTPGFVQSRAVIAVGDVYFGRRNKTDDSRTVRSCWAVKREQCQINPYVHCYTVPYYTGVEEAISTVTVLRVALEIAARAAAIALELGALNP